MVELEVVKLIKVSGQTRKLLRRLIPTKTRKVGPIFIMERKVTTSKNADS
jgi:hypothetical protein